MIRLIVGLGNPGEKYKPTRHNLGFKVAEELRNKWSVMACVSKFDALICEAHPETGKIFILTSETYMNESGKPIGEFARFYKITPEEVLVIYDDLDLPLGHLRLSEGGSSGGHNGVQSVIDNFGGNFLRLRIGIGSNRESGIPGEDYVLQKFRPEEGKIIEKSVAKAVEVTEIVLKEDTDKIKNQIADYNKSLNADV